MLINFSFSVIILIIGIITGIFVTLLLLLEKKNAAANRFLTALVLVSVGTLLHNFLIATGIYNQYNWLYFLPVIFSLGVGPLLYLYVLRLIGIQKLSTKLVLLHLMPVIIQSNLYFWCFLQSNDTKYDIYVSIYEPYAKPLQNILVYISVCIYLFFSFKALRSYELKLDNFYSNDERIALRWLKSLLYIFTGYYVMLVFFVLLSYSFHFSAEYFPSDLIRCVILFTIGIFAIRQRSLDEPQRNIRSVDEVSKDATQLQQSPISETELIEDQVKLLHDQSVLEEPKPRTVNEELLSKIVTLVETEQLYLNEELTVADIASKLDYSSRSISQTINAGLEKSFSRFINEYRVRSFIEKRSSNKFDNLTIMGLAYDCGFNSKSSFNRIYKEITGVLPKEQIKANN